MSDFQAVAKPGAMISQYWPKSREKEGETARAVEIVLRHGFFEALQTVEIPSASERKLIADIIRKEKVHLTYCVSRILNDNDLNLSDLCEENRKKSYKKVIACLEDAREAGAEYVSFISGSRPEEESRRSEGLLKLEDSLMHICEAASGIDPCIKIVIEPVDTYAHKRNTLGFSDEALKLCNSLREAKQELYICFDTAHALLNGEEICSSLSNLQEYIKEFHFCNCVLDKTHPLFGDRHIPFGNPGVIDLPELSRVMKYAVDTGFFNSMTRPLVLCEVLNNFTEDHEKLLDYCRDSLTGAWEMCMS